jgi:hypothetical protein
MRRKFPMYEKKIRIQQENSDKLTFPPQQQNDTTAQLYCTLRTNITARTISHQNQKTNPTPQLYGIVL